MTSRYEPDDASLLRILAGDGRPVLALGAIGLVLAGGFGFFLAATGEFLPHDLAWLGVTPTELRGLADGQVADFMAHDRAAFGGTLVAIGVLYLWLVAVPLNAGAAWAWRLLAVSAVLGFASFLAWLGFGYLDTWHATATLVLLPLFVVGLAMTRQLVRTPQAEPARPIAWSGWKSRTGLGRALLLLTGFGMVVAGITIVTIGTFVVFVPQDLEFIGLDRAGLDALNPRLVPLIAHDRSGFGGGLATAGLVVIGTVRYGRPSRSLWQALLIAGSVGFGAAIAVHGLVGYLDLTHVGPAILGAAVFGVGIVLMRPALSSG